MADTLEAIIDKLWIVPENAEWTPKTDTVSLNDIRQWLESHDLEVLGFANALVHDARFHIEPPLAVNEYKHFIKRYYGRCLKEDPKGKWADSRYSGGTALVNVFASLWRNSSVPREVVKELKGWLARLYVEGDQSLRVCIITATLEHLFEHKEIREFFSDWKKDPMLAAAHKQASEWYKGGGRTPLGKPAPISRRRSRK